MGASLRQRGARALIWLNRRRRQGRKLTRPSGGRASLPPQAAGLRRIKAVVTRKRNLRT